ncbi:MAG: hypothetical protein IT158_23870 [Bryobacterales bacterium]|nr:hypothetical protein [Bryobacterales bacterium]
MEEAVRAAPARGLRWWHYAIALFVVVQAAFWAYSPALRGPFLFDDTYLPMNQPNPPEDWQSWLVGVRPLLSLSFWVNYRISGTAGTLSYHVFNVLLHIANTLLIFLLLRKLLWLGGVEEKWRLALAGFGAGVFLLHPLQTESVAYIASRSETLSVLFFFAAFAVFLYRRSPAVSWRDSLAILVLFAAAASVKEHTVVLPAALLLTDYFFNPGFSLEGIRKNWRLYAPMAAAAAAGVAIILKLVAGADSAGFGLKGLAWYEYFFTQCRALWVYLRMFILPVGQTADHDFAISRSLFEPAVILGLLALAALTVAAIVFRRKYPLAAYGFLLFLILMAPTSSFLPIKDPLVERRLYLSMIGLLLIALEGLRRVRLPLPKLAAALAALVLLAGGLTYARSQVWSSATALWEDAVAKTPNKARPHFQLGYAYYQMGRCNEALKHYQAVSRLELPDYRLLVDWALAHDCLNQAQEALSKLERAAGLERTAHVYALMGMIHGKNARVKEAENALAEAEKLDPKFDMTYVYRGNLRLAEMNLPAAAENFRRALVLNPRNQAAAEALSVIQSRR